MKQIAIPFAAACTLLAGCATPAYVSPVEVTRFVGPSVTQLGQGTITIAAAPGMAEAGMGTDSLRFSLYATAVRQELEALGYTVVESGGMQLAEVSVSEFAAREDRRRGGVGVGGGASTGSYGSGVGVGVGVDLSSLINGPPPERIERQMAVTISPAAGGSNLWEGRASMTATSNSEYAGDSEAAMKIADALFRGFPGESGETIAVE